MHARRFACFVLGLWLGGSLFFWWMAWQNTHAAEVLGDSASPAARLQLKPLGGNASTVLRYAAAEQTRRYRNHWEAAQLGLGLLFFVAMLFGSREHSLLLGGILVLLALTGIEAWLLSPEWAAQARLFDFAPAGARGSGQAGVLEAAYWGIEALKFALALVLTGAMVFSRQRSGRSRDARRQLNMINKANYRGVNG